MQGTILLNYNENTRHIEEEEKNRFLRSLLEQMGISIDSFWSDETSLSVEQRIKLRHLFVIYSIQVIDDLDGNMKVYVEGELIAEWRKCTYKLKRDMSQLDPKKQLYLEMSIDCWSLFEEQKEE